MEILDGIAPGVFITIAQSNLVAEECLSAKAQPIVSSIKKTIADNSKSNLNNGKTAIEKV